jgi:hypothetical protein
MEDNVQQRWNDVLRCGFNKLCLLLSLLVCVCERAYSTSILFFYIISKNAWKIHVHRGHFSFTAFLGIIVKWDRIGGRTDGRTDTFPYYFFPFLPHFPFFLSFSHYSSWLKEMNERRAIGCHFRDPHRETLPLSSILDWIGWIPSEIKSPIYIYIINIYLPYRYYIL